MQLECELGPGDMEAPAGKDLLPSSRGCRQYSVPCGLSD